MNKLPDTELFPKECLQIHELIKGVLYYYDEHGQVVLVQEERRK